MLKIWFWFQSKAYNSFRLNERTNWQKCQNPLYFWEISFRLHRRMSCIDKQNIKYVFLALISKSILTWPLHSHLVYIVKLKLKLPSVNKNILQVENDAKLQQLICSRTT